MEVEVIEEKTSKVVARYSINMSGLNYTPSDEAYFSEAWKCAVDDGVVDADSQQKYRFGFAE